MEIEDLLYIVLLIIIIIALYYILNIIFNAPPDTPSNLSPECSTLTAGLRDISEQGCCNGTSNVKYDSELKLNISPTPLNYLTVCGQLCDGNVKGDKCMSQSVSSQVLFDNCIKITTPEGCRGAAKPVAVSNSIPYYGNEANLDGCSTHQCRV